MKKIVFIKSEIGLTDVFDLYKYFFKHRRIEITKIFFYRVIQYEY